MTDPDQSGGRPGPSHPLATPRLVALTQAGLYVLDKPSGLAVHPTGAGSDMMAWAREHLGAPPALAPINRLDLGTSGLVLCAAEPQLRAEIGHAFATGAVRKEYRALVFGRTRDKGVIRRALKDERRGHALEATTRYRRLAAFGKLASHLRVRPETGRRHQIRRHLQGIGHAVVGDTRYAPRRFRPIPGFPGRLWLHCCRLELPDGQRFAVELPEALAAHLALLERTSPALDAEPLT